MQKTRLIIDNDAGSDDACAIAICLKAEHVIVEVLAVLNNTNARLGIWLMILED